MDGSLKTAQTGQPPAIRRESSPNLEAPATLPSDAGSSFHLGYRPSLNGLRGLAVIAVVISHTWAGRMEELGFVAVDVFFVLSGFLITCLLLQEWEQSGKISLPAFYLRRLLRLFPALLVLLAVVCIYCFYAHPKFKFRNDLEELRAALFYYLNWRAAYGMVGLSLVRHVWSLSLEEQFYLLWPPLLWFMLRRANRASILNFILLGIFCSVGWRCLHIAINQYNVDASRLRVSLDTRADALLLGCALAVVLASGFHKKWGWTKRAMRPVMLVSAIGLIIFGLSFDINRAWMPALGWLVISLFAAFIILGLMTGSAPDWLRRVLEARWLVYMGTLSYSLYLWHYPIFMFFQNELAWPAIKYLPLSYGAITIATLCSYYLVERPFLRLKRRFQKVAG